ncbi:hypothetical protein N7466_003393 [Penicillium verhagenii]|uniref:uncharacterized protein n=1 Tax=Penicillium verhagenii TaxID=1562060 RepID=UPI0025457F70|nr:uncharacterized protein N7466_003393 [Penicillium verhagenii]KAJ5936943.1 hypothetical protein N7466_003393 [Penicillium verhagenii]
MFPRKLTHGDYTVGWVCVLEAEFDAARALLDEEDEPLQPGLNDDNLYLLGRLGKHNVVITCPESYGTSPAAQTVNNMMRTFPRIRFGLMVGVGGGAPKSPHSKDPKKDIRLGDVVVSEPHGDHSGVIQYDMGKMKDDNEFLIQSHMNKPPAILLKALKQVKSDHRFKKSKMQDYVLEVMDKMKDLPEFEDFEFPGRRQDLLFKADYRHAKGEDCQNCDIQQTQSRVDRMSENPVIHYGLIASGNAVMRSAQRRDELRDAHDVLCFEMEAAGLMNHFPCIVIRGICDYSDGHKSKLWQPYAAIVAAAYAKDLLRVTNPGEVVNLELAADVVKNFTETLSNVEINVSKIRKTGENDLKHEILQWLTPVDYGLQQSELLARREVGTGRWLLESTEFQEWLRESKQTLFCPGIPGAGKTFMTSIVIDHLDSTHGNCPDVGIAYVYCSYRSQLQKTSTDVFLSLLMQLTRGRQELPSEIRKLYTYHIMKGTRPTMTEVTDLLILVNNLYSRSIILIDALDEFYTSNSEIDMLLTELFRVQKSTALNLFATSRNIQNVTSHFEDCILKEISAQNDDILRFVDGQIPRLRLPQLSKYPAVQDSIRHTIIESAGGMFLLANLHMQSLLGQPTIGHLEIALKNLPSGESRLDDTYNKVVERIESQHEGHKDLARRILTWLTYSKRALSLLEIQHALAVRKGASDFDEKFIADAGTLGSVCAGLIIVDQKNGTIDFIHYTTKEFFGRAPQYTEAKAEISATCLTYLSLEAFNDGFCLNDASFDSRIQKYPFYNYAARYWGYHAEELPGEPENLMLEFLSNEAKVSGSYQAMMMEIYYYLPFTYSQAVPRHMTGAHLVTHFNLMKVMITLLLKGHDMDSVGFLGRTPLSLAAENGHVRLVLLLLTTDKVDADSQDREGRTPLSWAAEKGHKDVIVLLLATGRVDPDSRDKMGRTPLLWAVKQGHEAVAWLLLSNKRVNPNSKSVRLNWTSPLSLAAENGLVTVVWLLLKNDQVEIDPRDKLGQTPLSLAARRVHLEVVQLLLDRGADPNSADEHGQTLVFRAAEYGRLTVVQLLLDRGGDINAADNDRRTPVYIAVERGYLGVVQLLLDRGADPNTAHKSGETPLDIAIMRGNPTMVQLLLDRGADPNSADEHGQTLVFRAAEYGRLTVVQLLLDRGGDINAADNDRRTPVYIAVECGHLEVVRLLLDRGAYPNPADYNGWSLVHIAAECGHFEVVRLLLDRGAYPNPANYNGWSLVHIAAECGHLEVVRLLLDQGAHLNTADYNGWSPVHTAAAHGHLEVVRLLLDRGAYLNTADYNGWSPVHTAAAHGHLEVVRLLLDRGAHLNTANNDGLSPVHLAAECGNLEVVQLLIDRGADLYAKSGRTAIDIAADNDHLEVVELLQDKLAIWSSARVALFGEDE